MERFTISLDLELARQFDAWIGKRGYANRSEAVRDLLRARLESEHQAEDADTHCVACLSYVFDHHRHDLGRRLTDLQHDHHDLTVSTLHAHLDHDHCLEAVILRGPSEQVRAFSHGVCAQRDVRHGQLNLISVDLHPDHRHAETSAAHVHFKPVV